MSGPTTAQRPTGGPPALHRTLHPWHLLVVAVAVALLFAASELLKQPTFIDEITVENPTRYDITIHVTDAGRDGWMAVGTGERQSTSTFEEIIDQGEVWIFRFAAQGEDGGELRRSKAELERANWQVKIPMSVSDTLQSNGASFPP